MKSKSGFSSTIIIFIIAVIAFAGFLGWGIFRNQSGGSGVSSDQDITTIIPASDASGNIEEHIEGNPNAKLKIVEYSDYQCSGCASVVDDVEKIVEKYGDDVAIIHRTYVLSYHDNGIAAATAVEAAGLQGYWKAYGDYLFENQSDWYYSDATQRTSQFISYFEIVTKGKGNVDQFKSDMASDRTKAKVDFDISIAKQVSDKIQYTPAFFIGNDFIDWAYDNPDKLEIVDYFSNVIDEKLAELGETTEKSNKEEEKKSSETTKEEKEDKKEEKQDKKEEKTFGEKEGNIGENEKKKRGKI